MNRVIVKIDKQMLVEELYKVKALVSTGAEGADDAVLKLITLVSNAPIDTGAQGWAKIKGNNG